MTLLPCFTFFRESQIWNSLPHLLSCHGLSPDEWMRHAKALWWRGHLISVCKAKSPMLPVITNQFYINSKIKSPLFSFTTKLEELIKHGKGANACQITTSSRQKQIPRRQEENWTWYPETVEGCNWKHSCECGNYLKHTYLSQCSCLTEMTKETHSPL